MLQQILSKKHLLVGLMLAAFVFLVASSQSASAQTGTSQWLAQYYDNPNLTGANPRVTRNEAAIDHRWGEGSPVSGIPDDNFSVRWTKADNFPGGTIRFTATMDDGMRVYLDNNLIIDSWYPSEEHTMTRDVYVSPGIHELKVEYFEAGGMATAVFTYAPASGGNFYPNWRGEYFNNTSLGGAPVLVRDDRYLNNNWGENSPAPGIVNADYWSARWTRTLNVPAGTYSIGVRSDDGARVYFNNQQVFDNWGPNNNKTHTFNYSHAGGPLAVRVEYYDELRGALIQFSYQLAGPVGPVQPPVNPILPTDPTGPLPSECQAPTGMQGVVNTSYLNTRSGPGVEYAVVNVLEKCDVVILTGVIDPTYTWVQIQRDEFSNKFLDWVSARYLNTAVPVSSFRVGG